MFLLGDLFPIFAQTFSMLYAVSEQINDLNEYQTSKDANLESEDIFLSRSLVLKSESSGSEGEEDQYFNLESTQMV